MKSRRIVFLFRDMGTGGAQKIEAFVANAMYEAGYEVIAVNMASTACTVNIHPDIRIENLEYKAEKKSNLLSAVLYKFQYLLSVRKLLLKLKPDIVCAFLSDVVRIAALALQGTGIPVLGSERGDPYTFTEKQFDKYKKAYEKCKGAVFQLKNVAEKYDLKQCNVQRVIPNPCVPRKRDYEGRAENPDHIIISAGRLAEQKRFDLLIDAFEIVHRQYPEYQLYLYGDGPLREKLEVQAKGTTARDAIVFVGDVDDVFNEARNAEFFVLSSDFEGIPNVLLEAMSCGMGCVATDCSPGGARYLLNDGARGLIAPRGDKEELAKAMIRYIEEPALRREHELLGLQAVKDFAPDSIKKMWVEVFEACL